MKLKLVVELEYDESIWHADEEERKWFLTFVLQRGLELHSTEIGDEIGPVRVLEIVDAK